MGQETVPFNKTVKKPLTAESRKKQNGKYKRRFKNGRL